MIDTNQEFIQTYEALSSTVNGYAGAANSHSFEIEKAAHSNGLVRKNLALLKYIRDVRHALQHPKNSSTGHAFQISDAFLAETRTLLKHLKNPPNATSVGVPRKELMTTSLDGQLGQLAGEMKRRCFSHIPILNRDNILIGVFNEAAVFDHLWFAEETIIGKDMQIRDILAHCQLDAGHTETFRFVNPREPLDNLIDMFVAINEPNTRIGAVFVTASGSQKEAIHRMITPWDVLKTKKES